MKLVATHIPTAQAVAFEFTEPGGTIGRCPGNHLLLEDDERVGRVQAVVHIKEDVWSIMNVSSRTDIVLHGQVLPLLKEIPITEGDTLTVGDYLLRAGTPTMPQALAVAAPESEPMPAQAAQETSDIFKELLDGPGVLPVGQSSEAGHLHPFELASQVRRNHPDPMQELQGNHATTYGNMAYGPLNTEPENHDSHIFSNPTPSTLNLEDPLASQRKSLIDDALAHGHASGSHQENR